MTRCDDWPEKLLHFLESCSGRKAEWGKFDCCLFVCDAVLEMTGVDMAESFRSKYDSELGAIRVMREALSNPAASDMSLVEQLAESVAANHGLREIPPAFARRGDVGLAESPEGQLLGIVYLDKFFHVSPTAGLASVPAAHVRRAWRIG